MYAIIEMGGKQYKVSVGETVDVDKMLAEVGEAIELDTVLLVSDGDEVMVGRPFLKEAKVLATVVGQGRARKVTVFKYKPQVRYRRKLGHRQAYTRLLIDKIVAEG